MRMSVLSIVRRSDPDDALLCWRCSPGRSSANEVSERSSKNDCCLNSIAAADRSRRQIIKGHERLDEAGDANLTSLLEAGDPHSEVRITWHARETIRSLCAIDDPDQAATFIDELVDNMADRVLNAWAAVYRAAVEPAR